ncbi:MAG: sugar phosphorylase [Spirochaetes bacterium]|nr:sugar phosphorylase [Spirochaetota bacterium]
MKNIVEEHLIFLYGAETGHETYIAMCRLIEKYKNKLIKPSGIPENGLPLDERDAIVITYGDQFRNGDKVPLENLEHFFTEYVGDAVSGIHILPFSPYSSDDGFSIIDYRQVNPEYGTWENIKKIAGRYRLMVDLVCNHVSAESMWFREFLKGNPKYKDYFIVVPEGTDLSSVVRPRALPLLNEFDTAEGKKLLWTTFSRDQIDLNYKNPKLLLEMMDIMLLYIEMGAQIIRLDAIAYLWKEIGTSCIHLEQVHRVVQLFRAVFREAAPWVVIITETNVPHEENISYFGDGFNEAQMVYQFPLPPLVLDAFLRGEANHLREWASGLKSIEGDVTFFNFLASHDGVGLLPAHGILTDDEIKDLVELSLSHGGYVSYKATPGGDIPYELNITYYNAIVDQNESDELKIKKFLSSQSIMLSLKGVPGIYIHSLLGTENYREGVSSTGANRTVNRRKFKYTEIEKIINDDSSNASRVFNGFIELLNARKSLKAFHPGGRQEILNAEGPVFALVRTSVDGSEKVFCIHNVGSSRVSYRLNLHDSAQGSYSSFKDILSGRIIKIKKGEQFKDIELAPYETVWFRVV